MGERGGGNLGPPDQEIARRAGDTFQKRVEVGLDANSGDAADRGVVIPRSAFDRNSPVAARVWMKLEHNLAVLAVARRHLD
jgi:hypothetical protein